MCVLGSFRGQSVPSLFLGSRTVDFQKAFPPKSLFIYQEPFCTSILCIRCTQVLCIDLHILGKKRGFKIRRKSSSQLFWESQRSECWEKIKSTNVSSWTKMGQGAPNMLQSSICLHRFVKTVKRKSLLLIRYNSQQCCSHSDLFVFLFSDS